MSFLVLFSGIRLFNRSLLILFVEKIFNFVFLLLLFNKLASIELKLSE